MAKDVALALSVFLVASGFAPAGVSVLLCFTGLLLIGEALGIRMKNLFVQANVVVILLPVTKTGTHERVVIENKGVADFLRRYLAKSGLKPEDRFIDLSYPTFRAQFSQALERLGLGNINYRSHSMRRGGATALFMMGVDLKTIMVWGRWASESSCRLYIQSGDAAMIAIQRSTNPVSLRRIEAGRLA